VIINFNLCVLSYYSPASTLEICSTFKLIIHFKVELSTSCGNKYRVIITDIPLARLNMLILKKNHFTICVFCKLWSFKSMSDWISLYKTFAPHKINDTTFYRLFKPMSGLITVTKYAGG
jgi:hypothetical protein